MKEKYRDYMELLKAFVLERTPELTSDVNWGEIVQKAQINSTMGIIGYMLMLNPTLADPRLTAYGRHACMQEISLFSRRAEQMKLLINKMNEQKIDHLLFKGFILREFYPVPELRTFGDIDFVIRKEDRQKSNELMRESGYEIHDDWEPVFSWLKGTEYYEIHTDVMEVDVSEKADYKGYFKDIWNHVIHRENCSYEFEPEYHLLYLLTHIAKHINSSGAGIRMYIDIALFIKHYGESLNWDYVKEQFKILKFEDFANITFTAVEQWFGIKSPIALRPINHDVMDDFLAFTLDGGVYGHFGRDSSMKYLKNENRDSETVSKTSTIVKRLFPTAASIENRYTYLQGKHWLLPVAWIHRFFKTRDTWGDHATQAKNIMNADDEEVMKMRRLYKEIGL